MKQVANKASALLIAIAILSSILLMPAGLAEAVLRVGMKGSDVKTMKSRLYSLGYLSKSKVNTSFDSTTVTALKYFQVTAGIKPDGVADDETRVKLMSSSAPKKVNYSSLKKGNNNANVEKTEKRLNALGYLLSAYVDKKYTTETVEAVKQFQRDNGLTVSSSGTADALTLTYLFSSIAKSSSIPKVEPTPTPTPNPNEPVPTPAPTPWPTSFKKLTYGAKKNASVARMQVRLMELGYMEYVANPAGNYTESTKKGVEDFQRAHDLPVNGKTASVDMQKTLFSVDAYPYKTISNPTFAPGSLVKPHINSIVSVDWSKDAARTQYFDVTRGIFANGTIAVVTDVDTGISFQIKRKGGLVHTDVEPLTAFDTWQMYRIYKKNWSWTRRAVLVTVGDISIAGSMNGMPHDSSTIKDNNFDGHFCIHYINTRTHGTNKVDSAHQSMVKKAAKASIKTVQARIDAQVLESMP